MDNKLFELCKEVKRVTGWGEGFDDDAIGNPPLYTSDYLLEKLPHHITLESLGVSDAKYWNTYTFGKYLSERVSADTPLKALLKLTLALHEAGELS